MPNISDILNSPIFNSALQHLKQVPISDPADRRRYLAKALRLQDFPANFEWSFEIVLDDVPHYDENSGSYEGYFVGFHSENNDQFSSCMEDCSAPEGWYWWPYIERENRVGPFPDRASAYRDADQKTKTKECGFAGCAMGLASFIWPEHSKLLEEAGYQDEKIALFFDMTIPEVLATFYNQDEDYGVSNMDEVTPTMVADRLEDIDKTPRDVRFAAVQ